MSGKSLEKQEQPIDACALSVIVAARIDGPDRLENLRASTAYVRRFYTGAEMILVECDSESRIPNEVKAQYDVVVFEVSDGPFAKSRAMNDGLLRATRPIVAFYDIDVLVHPDAAAWAMSQIRKGKFSLALPFNGVFVDVDGARRMEAIADLSVRDLAALALAEIRARPDCTPRIVDGGVFFADRDVMLAEGGYNSRMVSYGWEDIEVLRRFEQLGYYRVYAQHNLVHLNHARGPDSVRNEHFDRNREEYDRIKAMPRAELRHYAAENLAITFGAEAERLRNAVRAQRSRLPFGLVHGAALLSKLKSRLRRYAM